MNEDYTRTENPLLTLILENMMKEREALLVRLGQIEDTLIYHKRLNSRTKPRMKRVPSIDNSR